MTSIIYKTHTNGSLSQSNEIDVIESYLNRRRRTDYTEVDKLLDTILQESTCSNNVSFQSGISNSNLSIRRNFDDAAEKRSENDSDVSDQVVLFQNVTEVDQSASLQLKQMGNHLENFYLVKVVRSWINFRPGSFSEMVVKVRGLCVVDCLKRNLIYLHFFLCIHIEPLLHSSHSFLDYYPSNYPNNFVPNRNENI